MDKQKKKEYYQKNKKKRLSYQREYYKVNKTLIKRKLELRKEGDAGWVKKQQNYNREYYIRNKEQIKKQRKAAQKLKHIKNAPFSEKQRID